MLEKQLQKEKVIQSQELSLLNDNQRRALSVLEYYSKNLKCPYKLFLLL